MGLEKIRQQVKQGKLYYTRHTIQQMLKRSITAEQVESGILNGEVIEEYPDDKYGPSCLVSTQLKSKWIHIVISKRTPIWVITAYYPDPKEWIDFKKRK